MGSAKRNRLATSILLGILVIAGCTGGSTRVTDIDEIAGTWVANTPGGLTSALRIHSDGTAKFAGSLEKLEAGVTNTWRIWVEGDVLRAEGPAGMCDTVATYEAFLLSNGNLKFAMLEDDCSMRPEWLEGSQNSARAEQYELEFVKHN
jgi:hypothetical protein